MMRGARCFAMKLFRDDFVCNVCLTITVTNLAIVGKKNQV